MNPITKRVLRYRFARLLDAVLLVAIVALLFNIARCAIAGAGA